MAVMKTESYLQLLPHSKKSEEEFYRKYLSYDSFKTQKKSCSFNFQKGELLLTVVLTAIAFIPQCSPVTSLALHSISLLSALAIHSKRSLDKKFILESMKVVALVANFALVVGWWDSYKNYIAVSALGLSTIGKIGLLSRDEKFSIKVVKYLAAGIALCGTLGLFGATYMEVIAAGGLGLLTLCKIALLHLEEDEEKRWQKVASILVNLFTLTSMLFAANNLMLAASVVNLLVMGYLLYAAFSSKADKDYFYDLCQSALWVMGGVSLFQQYY